MTQSLSLFKSFFIFTFLITCNCLKTTGIFKKSGAAFDVDTNETTRPVIHMFEGKKPLALNPRMNQGQTTIMNPGSNILSSKSIAENIANPFFGAIGGISNQLKVDKGKVSESVFNNNNLNQLINSAVNTKTGPAIVNQSFTTQNPNDIHYAPLRQLSLQQYQHSDPYSGLPSRIDITPKMIFHKPKANKNQKTKIRKQKYVGVERVWRKVK